MCLTVLKTKPFTKWRYWWAGRIWLPKYKAGTLKAHTVPKTTVPSPVPNWGAVRKIVFIIEVGDGKKKISPKNL